MDLGNSDWSEHKVRSARLLVRVLKKEGKRKRPKLRRAVLVCRQAFFFCNTYAITYYVTLDA